MKTYAMIAGGYVIDILLDQDKKPVWPPTHENIEVVAVECDNTVEIGMVYNAQADSFCKRTYEEPIPAEPIIPEPTPLTESEECQIDIMLNTEYIACLLESQLE